MAFDLNSGKGGVRPNINVTPLVDVVLVLLIIFMVVIPNMQDGKPVEIVKVKAADKLPDDAVPTVVTISVDEVFNIDEKDLPSREAALVGISQAMADNPRGKVLVRGDARLPYHVVRDFFAELREMGIVNVALAVGVNREWDEDEDSEES